MTITRRFHSAVVFQSYKVVFKGGQTCKYAKGGFDGFAGGVAGSIGPVRVNASAIGAGVEKKCRSCNKCGGTDPVRECCTRKNAKVGSAGAHVWRLKGEADRVAGTAAAEVGRAA